ncbi:hypothetical protein QBC39DRAFT_327827 [Podospora conica]|nr:hypothetical protein QBC39DRAFT_327827 [Schizothecium conicum]
MSTSERLRKGSNNVSGEEDRIGSEIGISIKADSYVLGNYLYRKTARRTFGRSYRIGVRYYKYLSSGRRKVSFVRDFRPRGVGGDNYKSPSRELGSYIVFGAGGGFVFKAGGGFVFGAGGSFVFGAGGTCSGGKGFFVTFIRAYSRDRGAAAAFTFPYAVVDSLGPVLLDLE